MRKTSLIDELISIPWWVNLLFAGIVYLLLKFVMPHINTNSAIQAGFYHTLHQLAAPIAGLLVITAFGAALRQLNSGDLFRRQANGQRLKDINWLEFEHLVGEAYRRQGYRVSENTGAGADGGVDLVLSKNGEKILVQCKHWTSSNVGVKVIRELMGVVVKEHADGGIVVCSGQFTAEAKAFAKGTTIDLITGRRLKRLIERSNRSRETRAKKRCVCPQCGSTMVIRLAKKGRFKGQRFMGCSRYPACLGKLTNVSAL